MQLGDVSRVETSQGIQQTNFLDITFVNVLVVINTSGQIWRDDDCNSPPPAWIEVDTSSWLLRCNTDNSNYKIYLFQIIQIVMTVITMTMTDTLACYLVKIRNT